MQGLKLLEIIELAKFFGFLPIAWSILIIFLIIYEYARNKERGNAAVHIFGKLAIVFVLTLSLTNLITLNSLNKSLLSLNKSYKEILMTTLDDKFTPEEIAEIRKQIDVLLDDVFGEAHNAYVPQDGRKVMCDGSADSLGAGSVND